MQLGLGNEGRVRVYRWSSTDFQPRGHFAIDRQERIFYKFSIISAKTKRFPDPYA
jgi:hypothetical protein